MDAIILDFGSDIKGDSLLVGYENKIEIMSYSHNVAMQVTNDVSNSGAPPANPRRRIHPHQVHRHLDPDPQRVLLRRQADRRGDHHHRPQRRRGQRADHALHRLHLNNVVLSNVSVSGGAGGKPVETLSLNFTKIKWELTAQKDDGTKEGTAASTWDLAANQLVK